MKTVFLVYDTEVRNQDFYDLVVSIRLGIASIPGVRVADHSPTSVVTADLMVCLVDHPCDDLALYVTSRTSLAKPILCFTRNTAGDSTAIPYTTAYDITEHIERVVTAGSARVLEPVERTYH